MTLSAQIGNHDYSIYVGKVKGITKTEFIKKCDKYDKWNDSLLNLEPLYESIYPIEIRLYENRSAMAIRTCTILYFDSSFHKIRVSKIYSRWLLEFEGKDDFSLDSIRADSTFYELVKNGIFSLNEYSEKYNDAQVLTKNGLILSQPFCVSTDGCSYKIQIKLNNIYKSILHDTDDEVQLHCTPDNNEIFRKKNIVDQLRANVSFIRK